MSAPGSSGSSSAEAPSGSRPDEHDTPPPFLGTWRNVYLLVLGELAALVAIFYALRRLAE